MFNALIGLFSQDLAVDLGTSRTRLVTPGGGVVCDEPTVLVVRRQRVVAIGKEARPMVGRTPEDMEAIQPVRAGQLVDLQAAEALLLHLVRRVHGRNGWIRPRVVVGLRYDTGDAELRALRDTCASAGARQVQFVPRALAAALGAGLPIQEPTGTLVVDFGGGTTEISLIALSDVVMGRVVPGGGEALDDAIVHWLAEERGLLVGQPSAEQLKIALGLGATGPSARITGRCQRTGLPRGLEVTAAELRQALHPALRPITDAIGGLLAQAPPALSSDVVDRGVVLTGGGSQLQGLEAALRQTTQLPFIQAEDPQYAVAVGLGQILEEGPPQTAAPRATQGDNSTLPRYRPA